MIQQDFHPYSILLFPFSGPIFREKTSLPHKNIIPESIHQFYYSQNKIIARYCNVQSDQFEQEFVVEKPNIVHL